MFSPHLEQKGLDFMHGLLYGRGPIARLRSSGQFDVAVSMTWISVHWSFLPLYLSLGVNSSQCSTFSRSTSVILIRLFHHQLLCLFENKLLSHMLGLPPHQTPSKATAKPSTETPTLQPTSTHCKTNC